MSGSIHNDTVIYTTWDLFGTEAETGVELCDKYVKLTRSWHYSYSDADIGFCLNIPEGFFVTSECVSMLGLKLLRSNYTGVVPWIVYGALYKTASVPGHVGKMILWKLLKRVHMKWCMRLLTYWVIAYLGKRNWWKRVINEPQDLELKQRGVEFELIKCENAQIRWDITKWRNDVLQVITDR